MMMEVVFHSVSMLLWSVNTVGLFDSGFLECACFINGTLASEGIGSLSLHSHSSLPR